MRGERMKAVIMLALGLWLLPSSAPADPSAPADTPAPTDTKAVETPAQDDAPAPSDIPDPKGAPAASPSIHTIRIKTQDGAILEADEYLPPGEDLPLAGIVLLHGFGQTRKAWGAFPSTLARSGYRVLAIDMRGHGGSSSYIGEPDRIREDPDIAPSDLRAAMAYLRVSPGIDPTRLAVIGAELGGDLACVASGFKSTRAAVALSPSSSRARLLARPRYLSMHSLLIVASSGDPEQEAQARRLYMEARQPKDLQMAVGTDGGEAILSGHADMVATILDWLDQNL